MQPNKVIKNISDVGKYWLESNILSKMYNIIRQFRLRQVNKWLNKAKTKGVNDEHIFERE
jgi:hypothetical protein